MLCYFKKWPIIAILVLIVLNGCGKRGCLALPEKEDIPYPRTYPKP
ncbi:MAG: hypothetical protein LBI30_03960 [Holosporales bacterium]|jgi:predicted small lipoprotein YifL|nr:hypothetical protein [Holosporales bacterium]